MIAWLYLAGGVVAQVGGITSLRLSGGMRRAVPTASTFLGIGVSVVFVSRALDAGLSLAVGYGVWTGAGIASTAVVGAVAFGDRLDRTQLVGLALVLIGSLVLQVGG
ncbi:multidrug efflux SMR transporter [Allobranchiibius sp. CTAmp26]|uniref:DMT family transporter n=1 Tax=Allobranchiibius sp. CTAmp26 TaxID=2815214 RepID=UPI001AA10ACC|nr:SMR family transporter [Allobranchiibius sp. CTAmp26]MBO1756144.1 QacE family quaternary ammonium compound efflux SMR transporter [Allobranchiibius sp. CTAmp26]